MEFPKVGKTLTVLPFNNEQQKEVKNSTQQVETLTQRERPSHKRDFEVTMMFVSLFHLQLFSILIVSKGISEEMTELWRNSLRQEGRGQESRESPSPSEVLPRTVSDYKLGANESEMWAGMTAVCV